MKTFFVAFLVGLLCLACSTPYPSLNKISVGMTKQQVIQKMGQPTTVRANAEIEYLVYRYHNSPWALGPQRPIEDYFVRLKDGTVDTYGRVGDFNSAQHPEIKAAIDISQR